MAELWDIRTPTLTYGCCIWRDINVLCMPYLLYKGCNFFCEF